MAATKPDPLAMARNCVSAVHRLAESMQTADGQLQAMVTDAGARGQDTGRLAAHLALVSIAEDVRRLTDLLIEESGGPAEDDEQT